VQEETQLITIANSPIRQLDEVRQQRRLVVHGGVRERYGE
jgi:hypothetical protein